MSCTVLLAAFSGLLRDQQMKPKSIQLIDSLEDLYEWKDLKIKATTYTQFSSLLKLYNESGLSQGQILSMATDFSTRIDGEELLSFDPHKKLIEFNELFDVNAVKEGKVAIIHPIDHLRFIKDSLVSNDFREDIDFHIAEDSPQRFFFVSNRMRFDEKMAEKLDLV